MWAAKEGAARALLLRLVGGCSQMGCGHWLRGLVLFAACHGSTYAALIGPELSLPAVPVAVAAGSDGWLALTGDGDCMSIGRDGTVLAIASLPLTLPYSRAAAITFDGSDFVALWSEGNEWVYSDAHLVKLNPRCEVVSSVQPVPIPNPCTWFPYEGGTQYCHVIYQAGLAFDGTSYAAAVGSFLFLPGWSGGYLWAGRFGKDLKPMDDPPLALYDVSGSMHGGMLRSVDVASGRGGTAIAYGARVYGENSANVILLDPSWAPTSAHRHDASLFFGWAEGPEPSAATDGNAFLIVRSDILSLPDGPTGRRFFALMPGQPESELPGTVRAAWDRHPGALPQPGSHVCRL